MTGEVWVARFARWHQPQEVRCGSRGEALGLLAHVLAATVDTER